MKNYILILFVFGFLISPTVVKSQQKKIINVGASLSGNEIVSAVVAAERFERLKINDTLQFGFKARVQEVCQMKGCWVRLELTEEKTVLVEFKDYGFFVPKDIAGAEMWVEGKAYITELSEGEHRHLARDQGASENEIKAIKGNSKIAGFEAAGVRIIK
jgi:hypothetical protein